MPYFRRLAVSCAFVTASAGAAAAGPSIATRAPDVRTAGDTVYEAKSSDGLAFRWRAPRRYDAGKGVGLTLILHGSNLTREWGFANHEKSSFRLDDVVVSPDGTTPNGNGGFNFLGEAKDAKRLHALIDELKKIWKVRATFLYGHSQGSFFALWYAGEHPDDVDGVVAHASGLWNGTKLGKHGHHQAIVLMHGTQDPVVPYVQSAAALPSLIDAGYPMARLRSLEGWNHWPAEHNAAGGTPHASQQLAWVEGMTTKDATRMEYCFGVLADVKDKTEHDWDGLRSLGRRAIDSPLANEATKSRAKKAVAVVDALAARHAAEFASVKPGTAPGGKAWGAHLPIYLRQFTCVPACDPVAAAWAPTLEAHRERGIGHLRKHFAARQKREQDVATAFAEGVAAIEEGFLWCEVQDRALRTTLEGWQKDAKTHKLSKQALKAFAAVEDLKESWTKGWEEYASICRSAGDP